MRKLATVTALAAIALAATAGGVSAPAYASTCSSHTISASNGITIINLDNPACYRVQAKTQRYVGTSIQTILGPESSVSSSAQSSNGVNAGNFGRVRPTSSESWGSWVRVYY